MNTKQNSFEWKIALQFYRSEITTSTFELQGLL
jgi:hypothetical protein